LFTDAASRLSQEVAKCKERRTQAQKDTLVVHASRLLAQVDRVDVEELEVLEEDLDTCRNKRTGIRDQETVLDIPFNVENSFRRLKVRRRTIQHAGTSPEYEDAAPELPRELPASGAGGAGGPGEVFYKDCGTTIVPKCPMMWMSADVYPFSRYLISMVSTFLGHGVHQNHRYR
jgi:hypothetical protein